MLAAQSSNRFKQRPPEGYHPPTTTPAPTQQGQSAAEPAETADAAEAATGAAEPAASAAETAAEANESALPGGGHADVGENVDHQFEGVE